MGHVPKGDKLVHGYSRKRIESTEYIHTTVEDLIEILNGYPAESAVWLVDWKGRISPLEITASTNGDVFLG